MALAIFLYHNYFSRVSNIHYYTTKNSITLSIPKVKLNYGRLTFLFSGAKILDELPFSIASIGNHMIFLVQFGINKHEPVGRLQFGVFESAYLFQIAGEK